MRTKHSRTPLLAILTACLIGAMGCSQDSVSPLPIDTGEEGSSTLLPVPDLLVGETPTNHLIGVRSIEWSPASSSFLIHVAVNKGLFTAARRANPDYCVQATLSVKNSAGQSDALDPNTQMLDEVKADLADPRPDPFIEFGYLIPWDGTDAQGNTLTGFFDVSYSFDVGFILHDGSFISLGREPVTGVVTLFIEQEPLR